MNTYRCVRTHRDNDSYNYVDSSETELVETEEHLIPGMLHWVNGVLYRVLGRVA